MNAVVELSGSGLDTFFSNQLTLQQAQSITTWGAGNPPGYVKGGSYGMYAVLSADWNPTTDAVLKLLETSATTVAMTKTLFTNLAQQGSAKFFCKGPAGQISLTDVLNGNW
jgi:hypothetical protein